MRAKHFLPEAPIGLSNKRPARAGSRPDRGHSPVPLYKDQSVTEVNLGTALQWPEVVNKVNSVMKAMGWKGTRKGDDVYMFSSKGQETDDQFYFVIIDNAGEGFFTYALGTVEDGDPHIDDAYRGQLPNTEASVSELINAIRDGFGLTESLSESKTQKQEAPKPRNFVAKNATTSGAGAHKDKKKAEKQGDVKHKGKMLDMAEDAEPMDREFALVKKLGRLGERIVQNPKLWDKYSEENDGGDPDWIISLIQDGTGATFEEVLRLSDLFGEIGGGMGRIIDFAWAVKEGTWEEDFLNPYRQHRSKRDMAEALQDGTSYRGNVKHKSRMMDLAEMEAVLEKASLKLCKSSTPDEDLGASNLASCKSQGLRARDGKKSHKLGKSAKSRVTMDGHKIKGDKYGGPLPDWS